MHSIQLRHAALPCPIRYMVPISFLAVVPILQDDVGAEPGPQQERACSHMERRWDLRAE